MKADTAYRIVDRKEALSSRELADALTKEGQMLLPILELIQNGRRVVDEVIDVMGRGTIEALLNLSAKNAVGEKHQGKQSANDGGISRHGRQDGVVPLGDRRLRVSRPRLRRRADGDTPSREEPIPVYQAMRSHPDAGGRLLEILLRGVSTRKYQEVLPEMAGTLGVERSSVSREFVEASAQKLKELNERRFDDTDILVIYIDGTILGDFHVITALGVDAQGAKHLLGMREGASENAAVVKALLEDLVQRGIKPAGVAGGRRRLFVIDGSKALRAGIDAVFGADNPVQRCRNHKLENVAGHLPEDDAKYAKLVMRAAFKMDAKEGIKKLKELAGRYQDDHPSAAGSLLEGLDELFTINRLGLPPALRRSLGTTHIIESPQGTMKKTMRRVTNWQSGNMALRWAAASGLEAERTMRKIGGYRDLSILDAALKEEVAQKRKVA